VRSAPGLFLSIVLACGACGDDTGARDGSEGAPRADRRLLVVGWDGASFRAMEPLRRAGKLPHVQALLERGVGTGLLSTVVPISSAAWMAAATGKGPGETGVYGFFEPVPGSYDVRLVSALSNRATPIWRALTRDGLSSIVFGVPLTYPPEPILGTMVAGMLAPTDAVYTWPAALAERLRERGYEPDLEPWLETRRVDYPDVFAHLELQRQILLELLAQDDWSLAWAVFKDLDGVAHFSYERDLFAQVAPVYERLDAILGELVEAVGSDANVLLVSDHGFHEYRAGFNLHAWLVEAGWSTRREKVKRFAIDPNEPLARRERDVVRQLRDDLEWHATRAYSYVTEGNCGAIRLNLAGREPEGIVAPDEAPAVLAGLAAELEQALDAQKRPVVRRVWLASELYPGPWREALPDLVFAVDPELQVFSDAEETSVVGEYVRPVPDHDLWGVLVAAGPSIARGAPGLPRPDAAEDVGPFLAALAERTFSPGEPLPGVMDVAPTALHLLGRPVPRSMQGRVLDELLRDVPSVRFVDAGEAGAPAPVDAPFTPEELEELEARLRALGYR
jgi:predicted AlkP superfamily phosphohydrolase/phosphomutase